MSVCVHVLVYVCVCVCLSPLEPLFYPQLREADRSRRSSSMGLGGPMVSGAAPPVPEEPRLETVALSEYSGITSNWPPSTLSCSVCVSSASSSLSTTWQEGNSISKCRRLSQLRHLHIILYWETSQLLTFGNIHSKLQLVTLLTC